LKEISEGAGQKLDNLFAELDATGHSIPSSELSGQIDMQLRELEAFPEGFGPEIERLKSFQRDLERSPVVGASRLRQMSQIVGDRAFDSNGAVVDKEAFEVWKGLKDATDNIADQVGGEIGAELKQANQTYHAAQQARPAIARKVAKLKDTSLIVNPVKKTLQKVEGEVIDSLVGTPQWLQKNVKRLGRFAPVLQQAISRGGQSAAVNFYKLQQTNSEFRDKLKELRGRGCQWIKIAGIITSCTFSHNWKT
jgi:hypothetical protein